jgi:uncharacterized protein YbjT (DUF2867 family)
MGIVEKRVMKPILVTGVGGKMGGLGQKIVDNLLGAKVPVRAVVFRSQEVARELERKGVEVVVGNLTDLHDAHRAIAGCDWMYFGMAVSDKYLEATANVAAVAKYHRVKAFVNMSQMTVSQMSITETTPSPQQKLHWLSEQVLNWSGLPVVHVRPTIFMEGFYLFVKDALENRNEMRVPFGKGRSSPIAASDVAFAISTILLDAALHIGKVYELTGAKSQSTEEIAEEYSRGLGRKVALVNLSLDDWRNQELGPGSTRFPPHTQEHIGAMALLHQQNRYDRHTEDFKKLTGREPVSIAEWMSSARG